MTQIQLDEIFVNQLYALQKEIDSYINSQNAAERAFCEGYAEYEEIQEDCLDKARRMKQRIRELAISLGIHAEFLDEYMASCKRNEFKVVVAESCYSEVPSRQQTFQDAA